MPAQERWRAWRLPVVALIAYAAIAVAYTWPLLWNATDRIPSDPYDPVLNASILWWNATVLPFSSSWWSPPHFFPTGNVAAFTENLVGLSPISAPILWLTGNPILTYNVTFLLTWVLSAFTVFQLVRFLVRRADAAFIAGLAFGFAPYRLSHLGHLQVLAAFWLPLALLAMHRSLENERGRTRWLTLFGVAWLLQSLSNGYYMFFGGILLAMWLLYFGSRAGNRRGAIRIGLAWIVASMALAVVMWKYNAIHQSFGLTRGVDAAISLSAQPQHWLGVADTNWFWSAFLTDVGPEFNLFPGVMIVALVVVAALAFVVRCGYSRTAGPRRTASLVAVGVALVCFVAVVAVALSGPLRLGVSGVTIRISSIWRPAAIGLFAAVLWVWLTPAIARRLRDRSIFAFYAAATITVVILACGPEIHRGTHVFASSAPYRWLLAVVPGLDGLRVVARFWMMGALCLAVAGASAFAWLVPRTGTLRGFAFVVVCVGILLDGWPGHIPLSPVPVARLAIESPDVANTILELPLGPKWDAAATFRAVGHRRRVVNGVSGYDPPHYGALERGLDARDSTVLLALASLGPLDVVLDSANDPDGSLAKLVEGTAGASKVREEGTRVLYRIPQSPPPVDGAGVIVLDQIRKFTIPPQR